LLGWVARIIVEGVRQQTFGGTGDNIFVSSFISISFSSSSACGGGGGGGGGESLVERQ